MAKADGSFVERNAKERQKKNTMERGALSAALLLLLVVVMALPTGQQTCAKASRAFPPVCCSQRRPRASLCLAQLRLSLSGAPARAEKLMNRSKTKGAAPAPGAAPQVTNPTQRRSMPSWHLRQRWWQLGTGPAWWRVQQRKWRKQPRTVAEQGRAPNAALLAH